MKLNKLLVTMTAFALGLSACSGSKVKPLELYEVEGECVGFPTEVVNTFLTTYNAGYTLPSIGDETTPWEYYVGAYLYYGYYMQLVTEDNGTIGQDSMEDQYLAILTEAGITVDDSEYDDYGYCVFDANEDLSFNFYTYNGNFGIYASAYLEPSEKFPTNYLQSFLKMLDVSAKVPAPVSENDWFYIASSTTFFAYTVDDGTPGTNAIEDSYKATLAKAGWTIDETSYEDEGYYATKDGIEICFYSYDGEFDMYLYLQEEIPTGSELQ